MIALPLLLLLAISGSSVPPDESLRAAREAYERGAFEAAERGFEVVLRRGQHDGVALLRAMGHCALARGDAARALWHYLRARGPESATEEDPLELREARRELGLPAEIRMPGGGVFPGPRPLWWFVALTCQTAGLLVLVYSGRRRRRGLGLCLVVLGLVASVAVLEPVLLPPDPVAVVLQPELEVRESASGGDVRFRLRAGELVRLGPARDGVRWVAHELGGGYVRPDETSFGELENW